MKRQSMNYTCCDLVQIVNQIEEGVEQQELIAKCKRRVDRVDRSLLSCLPAAIVTSMHNASDNEEEKLKNAALIALNSAL